MELFTESGEVKAFREFLSFRGVDDTGNIYCNALNELCRNIRKRYNPPYKGERPYTSLRRLAGEAPSEKQFLHSISTVLFSSSSVAAKDISDAAAYFFHFASGRSIEEIFAEYVAGRYRLGYEYLAQYLACSLFEKVINKKYEAQQAWWSKRRQNPSKLALDKKIEHLLPDTLRNDSIFTRREVFKDYIYKVQATGALEIRNFSEDDDARLREVRFRLHNFRFLRNNIIHGELEEAPDEKPNNRDEFIYYVWSELAPNSFDLMIGHWKKFPGAKIKECLWEISADYMTRAVDETMSKDRATGFNGLKAEDFENMYNLRRRLSVLKNDLEQWLQQNYPTLTTDILTTIDTTSAYIWMPFVPAYFKKRHSREGIFNCCVSILATPLDIRFYMDFGGYAQEQRFAYYQFLESAEYDSYFSSHFKNAGIVVFDIDWYSAMHNRASLSEWSSGKTRRIAEAKEKLLTSPRPITWNRVLHGYSIDARTLTDTNSLQFEVIIEKLKPILSFYEAFKAFKPTLTFDQYKTMQSQGDEDERCSSS